MAQPLPASAAGTAFPGAPTLGLLAQPGSCNSFQRAPPTTPRGTGNELSVANTHLCWQPSPAAFQPVNAPGDARCCQSRVVPGGRWARWRAPAAGQRGLAARGSMAEASSAPRAEQRVPLALLVQSHCARSVLGARSGKQLVLTRVRAQRRRDQACVQCEAGGRN